MIPVVLKDSHGKETPGSLDPSPASNLRIPDALVSAMGWRGPFTKGRVSAFDRWLPALFLIEPKPSELSAEWRTFREQYADSDQVQPGDYVGRAIGHDGVIFEVRSSNEKTT